MYDAADSSSGAGSLSTAHLVLVPRYKATGSKYIGIDNFLRRDKYFFL